MTPLAVGCDGCKGGWVAVWLDASGGFARADVLASLTDLASELSWGDVVGVDTPIGHVTTGVRECDVLARRALGSRGSTVFPAPHPDLLTLDYAAANAASKERFGVGLSKQGWHLREAIWDAARLTSVHDLVFEVHPERSFLEMTGAPLPSKHTWAGLRARERALAEQGIVVPADIGPGGSAGIADVLDACAVAWTAQRIANGSAQSLPDPPQQGIGGHPVAIWF